MKNLIIILLVGSLVWLSSCGDSPPTESLTISVLVDRTDKLELNPEKDKIFSLFKLDPKSLTEVQTGVQIRVSELTSVDFNRAQDISIPAVNYKKINIKARQKEIKIFYEKLNQAFDETEVNPKGNSSIYVPIARELNRIAKTTSQQKILVVYSDLAEHSSWLNAYREYRLPTEVLVKRFNQQIALSDLSGVKMIIRYIPRSTGDDNQRFNKLLGVYTQILESKGATISFEY